MLSHKLGYPILADGTSQLRFGRHKKNNIISNFDAFLRSEKFVKNYNPEIILQFGRTITSKGLETFLNKCSSVRYMINEYGDWFDPSDKATAAYACKPYFFCQEMISLLDSKKINRRSNGWLSKFKDAELLAAEQKAKIIGGAKFPTEGRIIEEIINEVPDNCMIMLSNSMPVRDFDYFASNNSKSLVIHNNRGASGIDGITSTALGIAEASKKPTLLITGDLAFYYDLNGLLGAKKYAIPLVIVLINNNGGGIFEILPISNYGKVFNDYFIAPHHLDFSHFVKAYGGNYSKIHSWPDFRNSLKKAFTKNNFSVLEIKTDAVESTKLRRKFWNSVSEKLEV